jgi:bifunctional DNA-binding transcriptional regulator/antitoxin component of YhaV-PrlF toxin-antitoxin module
MEFAIAKISTKGQIVIPHNLRGDITSGDEFLMVKENNNIILKNVKDLAENLRDDFKFAKHVSKAWERYDQGKFKSMPAKEFLEELEKW